MRHQLDIVGIIAAHVVERVAEALAAGKMLLEVGEAAVERVAARVDDLRVGQDQPDQADMGPIVGHLVDEEGPVGLALDAGALEIFLAERARAPPASRSARQSG